MRSLRRFGGNGWVPWQDKEGVLGQGNPCHGQPVPTHYPLRPSHSPPQRLLSSRMNHSVLSPSKPQWRAENKASRGCKRVKHSRCLKEGERLPGVRGQGTAMCVWLPMGADPATVLGAAPGQHCPAGRSAVRVPTEALAHRHVRAPDGRAQPASPITCKHTGGDSPATGLSAAETCFPAWKHCHTRSDHPGIPLRAEGPRIHSLGLFSQRPTPFQDPITLKEMQPPKTSAPRGAGPWQPG